MLSPTSDLRLRDCTSSASRALPSLLPKSLKPSIQERMAASFQGAVLKPTGLLRDWTR